MLSLTPLLFILPHTLTQIAWPASGPEVCVVPSTVNIRPWTTCADVDSVYSPANTESAVVVNAQRGETESVQILVRKDIDLDDKVGGMSNLTVAIDGLPSGITFDAYQVGYVYTRRSPRYQGSGGGWRPDPLMPLTAPIVVLPGVTQSIWISYHVEETAVQGNYTGTITLHCTEKCGNNGIVIHFAIRVFNIVLPELQNSEIGTAWSGNWDASTFAPYYQMPWSSQKFDWFQMMMDHRTPPDSIYLKKSRAIDDYEWLAKHGAKWFALLDVSSLDFPTASPPRFQGAFQGACGNFTQEYVDNMLSTLTPIVESIKKLGILDRAYVYGFDENPRSCEPQVRKLFSAVKTAFPSLKTAAALNWSPMPVDLPVDIWILKYQEFNASDVKAWVDAGKLQWHYHCIEPHSLKYLNTFIERPGMQSRLLFWLAALNQAKYGAPTGWLYYAVNLWRPCNSPRCGGNHTPAPLQRYNSTGPFVDFPPANFVWLGQHDDIFVNGDGQYVYPGNNGPLATTRLENIRDGLEDWELFKKLNASDSAPLLQSMVRSATDWSVGFQRLSEARLSALKILASRL